MLIDKALEFSGWNSLDSHQVRFELNTATGRADYLLGGQRGPLCVLEAKREDVDAAKKRLQKIKAAGFISERSPGLRERPLAWVEFVLFDRRYFVVGAGGGVGGVLVLLAGGKVLSRNWSRMPVLAGLVAGHCRSAAF